MTPDAVLLAVRPIALLPAKHFTDGVEFSGVHNKWQFNGQVASEISQIVEMCDGRQTVGEILKAQTLATSMNWTDIICDLFKLGILHDAGRQFWSHLEASKNPSPFQHRMSSEEISQYTLSPRQEVKHGQRISVPMRPSLKLDEIRMGRRSCRSFSANQMRLQDLWAVLCNSYDLNSRSVPSAGGLYPIRIFVLVSSPQVGLDAGYYEFDPETLDLILFDSEPDEEQLRYCFNSESLPYGSQVQVIIAADLERHAGKYANRGYRFTLIEAGLVAQNMVLAAAEAGIRTCLLGSFIDDAISSELGLESGCAPLLAVALGYASSEAIPPTLTFEEVALEFVGDGRPIAKAATSNLRVADASLFGAYADYRGNKVSTISGGTATSVDMAKVKATLEGVERFTSGLQRVDVTASLQQLRGASILDPDLYWPLSTDQRERQGLARFDPSETIQWVRGKSVVGNNEVLVPIDYVFYPLSGLGRSLIARANSSGVALFSDAHEAARRGLLELIERDALVRLWLSQEAPMRLRLDSTPLHERKRARFWRDRGREVHLLDLSADGVAICLALIIGDEPPFFSSGAAADEKSMEVAVRKAFREAEFALLSHSRAPHEVHLDYEEVRYVSDHADLHRDRRYVSEISWIHAGDRESKEPVDIGVSIEDLHVRYETVVVDLKARNRQYPVVRVLSTHLVPIAFGFDALPWLHPALESSKINPTSRQVPHFFS